MATSHQLSTLLTIMRRIAGKDRPWPGQALALHRGYQGRKPLASSRGGKWAPSGIFKVLISSVPVVLWPRQATPEHEKAHSMFGREHPDRQSKTRSHDTARPRTPLLESRLWIDDRTRTRARALTSPPVPGARGLVTWPSSRSAAGIWTPAAASARIPNRARVRNASSLPLAGKAPKTMVNSAASGLRRL